MKVRNDVLKLIGMQPTGDLGHLTCYTSRRAGTVWFPRSPPTTPAQPWQRRQRNRFRLAAQGWRHLDETSRQRWKTAARLARLYVSGYNLWLWWQLTHKRAHLRTIERQSGIQLVPT